MTDPVLLHCLTQKDQILSRLCDLLRCPSVSTDPAYEAGMESARNWLEHRLHDIGFHSIQRLQGGGHPALFAQWNSAPDKPTLLVYGHYDVQPPDPCEKWHSPPFEPSQRNGNLYARGASDDKGPSVIALEAIAGFLEVEGMLPVNIKLLFEGEEETGSPSLGQILSTHRELLSADAILSADGARWRADLPTVNVGCRGNSGFGIRVQTACKDLHSGRYGGAVPNALHIMSKLIASLHDDDNRVNVPGFYAGIKEPTERERQAISDIPFDETHWFSTLDTTALGEVDYSTLERLWLRPTLEVNGLWGGYQGPGAKTVIPNEACAKITTRLVTGQNPARINAAIKHYLCSICPPSVQLEFIEEHGSTKAYSLPLNHPLLAAAENALLQTTGCQPIHVRIGATLPLTDIVTSTLGIDTVMFSFSTADEDFHAPNEFLRLSSIDEGLAAWITILRNVGQQKISDYTDFKKNIVLQK